jgi:hypothetical protein
MVTLIISFIVYFSNCVSSGRTCLSGGIRLASLFGFPINTLHTSFRLHVKLCRNNNFSETCINGRRVRIMTRLTVFWLMNPNLAGKWERKSGVFELFPAIYRCFRLRCTCNAFYACRRKEKGGEGIKIFIEKRIAVLSSLRWRFTRGRWKKVRPEKEKELFFHIPIRKKYI